MVALSLILFFNVIKQPVADGVAAKCEGKGGGKSGEKWLSLLPAIQVALSYDVQDLYKICNVTHLIFYYAMVTEKKL